MSSSYIEDPIGPWPRAIRDMPHGSRRCFPDSASALTRFEPATRVLLLLLCLSMRGSRARLVRMRAPRVPADERAAVLAEIGALLGSALDHERALSRLVRLAVPVLGDLCAIDLVQDKGELHRAACAHVDTTKEALVYEIRARHGFNPTAAQGVPAVIRTRRPTLVARATEADLDAVSQNAEQPALFPALRQKARIIVPLVAPAPGLGAVTPA